MKSRDVDKLDPLPDGMLKKQDADYLEKHGIQPLFNELVTKLITLKPMDPIQYMIDYVQYGEEYAKQDDATGLPNHRKENLEKVFEKLMQPAGDGTPAQSHISFETFHNYVSKFGVTTLASDDLKSIFKTYNPKDRNMVNLTEFFTYFAKVSATIANADFEDMVRELSGDATLYR